MNTHTLTAPTTAEREQIRETRTKLFIARDEGKQHLNPTCERCPDDYHESTLAAYPGDHLDLCLFCVERWRRWEHNRTAVQPDSDGTDADAGQFSDAAAAEFLERVAQ